MAIALLAALLLTIAGRSHADPNLVTNGDFTNGTLGWTGITPAHITPDNSLDLINLSMWDGFINAFQTLNTTPNAYYDIKFRYYNQGTENLPVTVTFGNFSVDYLPSKYESGWVEVVLPHIQSAGAETKILFGEWTVSMSQNKLIDNISVSPSPVPVPAAAWLLGSGVVGLLGLRRRAKRV